MLSLGSLDRGWHAMWIGPGSQTWGDFGQESDLVTPLL